MAVCVCGGRVEKTEACAVCCSSGSRACLKGVFCGSRRARAVVSPHERQASIAVRKVDLLYGRWSVEVVAGLYNET